MATPIDVYVTLSSGAVDKHPKVADVENGELGIAIFYPDNKKQVFYPNGSYRKLVIEQ